MENRLLHDDRTYIGDGQKTVRGFRAEEKCEGPAWSLSTENVWVAQKGVLEFDSCQGLRGKVKLWHLSEEQFILMRAYYIVILILYKYRIKSTSTKCPAYQHRRLVVANILRVLPICSVSLKLEYPTLSNTISFIEIHWSFEFIWKISRATRLIRQEAKKKKSPLIWLPIPSWQVSGSEQYFLLVCLPAYVPAC